MTLPEAVILNRFATAFLVLLRAIAFGMEPGRIPSDGPRAIQKVREFYGLAARRSASVLSSVTVVFTESAAAHLARPAMADLGWT